LKIEDLTIRFDKLDMKLDKVAQNVMELKVEFNKTFHKSEL